jgi:hypothetical protein
MLALNRFLLLNIPKSDRVGIWEEVRGAIVMAEFKEIELGL